MKCRNVFICYVGDRKAILKSLFGQFRSGEFSAIMGPSGNLRTFFCCWPKCQILYLMSSYNNEIRRWEECINEYTCWI